MMKVGTKEFTQAASSEYKSITVDEKEKLRQRCEGTSKELTARKIKLEGRRIFKSISLKVSPINGYQGIKESITVLWSIFLLCGPIFPLSVWNPGFHLSPVSVEPLVPSFPCWCGTLGSIFPLLVWNPGFHLPPAGVEL